MLTDNLKKGGNIIADSKSQVVSALGRLDYEDGQFETFVRVGATFCVAANLQDITALWSVTELLNKLDDEIVCRIQRHGESHDLVLQAINLWHNISAELPSGLLIKWQAGKKYV